MNRSTIIGFTLTALVVIGVSGCAGVPVDREAHRDRSSVLGSNIKVAARAECSDPWTSQSVVRICNEDLRKTGAPDAASAVQSRVPSLNWSTGPAR